MKPFGLRSTFVVLCLAATGLAAAGANSDKAKTQAQEFELQQLKNNIRDLRSNLQNLHGKKDTLQVRLQELERHIDGINHNLHTLNIQRQQQSLTLTDLQRQRQDQETRLSKQRAALARQLRAAYVISQQNPLKLVLNQTEPAALSRSLRYYDYFQRARSERIATINDTLTHLAALEQNIGAKNQVLSDLYLRQRERREALELSRRHRDMLLVALDRDIADKEQHLTRLTEDERALRELIQRLRHTLAGRPSPILPGKPFSELRGQLQLPVAGHLSAHFGASRQLGQLKWQGVVIDADQGSEVHAIAPGRVVFANRMRGFGLLLIIDHGGGYMSLYGYNQNLYKKVNDAVKAREVIATVGMKDDREQSGLYFEIRERGIPVDPLLWCR